MNTNFYSIWFDPISNRTPVDHFSSKRSIHSTTDRSSKSKQYFHIQATSKQKLNPWEIIEGLKYPAPLCLAWFGARKTERKLMRYAEKRLHLFHHEHGNKRWVFDVMPYPCFILRARQFEILKKNSV